MASLQIIYPTVNGATSNTFIVRLLDEHDQPISRFTQDQVIIIAGISNPTVLIVNLPDGQYQYPVLKIRVFNESVNSGRFSDVILNNFEIDCVAGGGDIPSPGTTLRQTTVGQQTTVQTSLPGIPVIINTTVNQNQQCKCNGVATFNIFPVNGQYVQFVSATPVDQTVNNQKTTGTHRITFNSCGVTKLIWGVYAGNTLVKTGDIAPMYNNFLVDLSILPTGTYNFVLTAVLNNGTGCSGVDVRSFNIVQNTIPSQTTNPQQQTTVGQQTTTGISLLDAAGFVPTFQGIINQYSYQSNPSAQNLVKKSFENGRIEFEDQATEQPSGGLSVKYLVDGFSNKGSWINSLSGLTFDPAMPIIIQKFWVNANSDYNQWQATGAKAYSNMIID